MKPRIMTVLVAALASTQTLALQPLPRQPGWSGFINLGVTAGTVESNFLARIKGIDLDLGEETIDAFDSPDDEDIVAPAFGGEIGYLFGNGKTRLSIGNDLVDYLQFDRSTLLAARHDIDGIGRFQLGFLNNAALATEVWEDPYILDAPRNETEIQANGLRFTWDKIFNTGFELKVQGLKRELDEERSGEALGLTDAEQALLDREGDLKRAELGYALTLGQSGGGSIAARHIIRPSVTLIDRDLDGGAMAGDGYAWGLSYAYNGNSVQLVTNFYYADLEGDKRNPIFNKVVDSEEFGASGQVFFPGLFGLDEWVPTFTVAWGEEDADIDFYDSQVFTVSVSMFRTF